MSYSLSLLDKSPIPAGAGAAEALRETVLRAQRAEALGYTRYWIAEHHGAPGLASSAPEVVVAAVLAQTSRIRVGSGGVLLQHYSPFKVAETFRVLAALAPGRVDLGIGKAPGGLPLQTRALQSRLDRAAAPSFEALLAELDLFLTGTPPEGHPLAGAAALPEPPELPRRTLLGGSEGSAAMAARLGWEFTFAGHFNGDPEVIGRSLDLYRQTTGRPASLALNAIVAPTREKAERLAGSLRIVKARLPNGTSVNLPSLEAAAEFARQAGVTDYRTEELTPHVVHGTPDIVRRELDMLARRYGVEEFVLDNPVPDFAERLASIELLVGVPASLAA